MKNINLTYFCDTNSKNNSSFATDVIYQIVTDRFFDGDNSNNPSTDYCDKNNLRKYHGGDWCGIIKMLDSNYFTDLGVSALWISSPVLNSDYIDPSNGCAAYHGYWGCDFFNTNKYFGTMDEFKALVNKAHAKGIKIIIDFAPNHTSFAIYDGEKPSTDGVLYRNGKYVSSYSKDTDMFNHVSNDWALFDTWEHTMYAPVFGLADLNHQNPTIDQYMKDAIKVWLDAGIDGIRLDAVKHMSLGWQKNLVSYIYSYKPVFIFGEWSHASTKSQPCMESFANHSGMSLLDFRYNNAIRKVLAHKSDYTMIDFHKTMVDEENDYEWINDQVTFIDCHDQSRFLSEVNGDKLDLELTLVLHMVSRGVPCIYYGTEQYMSDLEGGLGDPYNRGDMISFKRDNKAYQLISKLALLRKNNLALGYGCTKVRWLNDDVYVFERLFGNSVVFTAINRNKSKGYYLKKVKINLPDGEYFDVLAGLLGTGYLKVKDGIIDDYYLGASNAGVWQYNVSKEGKVLIGNVNPKIGKAGNIVTISGCGFKDAEGVVKFNDIESKVISWNDNMIEVCVPKGMSGKCDIKVSDWQGDCCIRHNYFDVLTNDQVSLRFKVNNAFTKFGTNVYIVGNVTELGNWDVKKGIGPLFNNTPTIGEYPTWFFDISVPADNLIEFKFVKVDHLGNVIWEEGLNHTYVTPVKNTGEVSVNWQ